MNTDDAPVAEVLMAIRTCAFAWEPGARIIGNIRAVDISRACDKALWALQFTESYRRAEESQAEEDHAAYADEAEE